MSELPKPRLKEKALASWKDPTSRGLLGFALAFCVLFNTSHFAVHETRSPLLLLLAFLVSLVGVGLLFMLASLHRWLFALIVPVSSVLSAASVYFIRTFHVYVNENTLGLVFETNSDEAGGLLSVELFAYVFFGFASSLLCVRWFLSSAKQTPLMHRLHWSFVLGVLALVVPNHKYIRNASNAYLPVSLFAKTYVYFREAGRRDALLKSRRDISKTHPGKFDDQELTVVLVIGESARADHFSLNGYARKTSPKLEQRGVVSMADVTSCDANTRYSVPCMMTRGTPQTMKVPYEETSFVSMFRRVGFDTHWISNQGTFWANLSQAEFTVSAITAIAEEAEHVRFINKTGDTDFQRVVDESLLPHLDAALQGKHDKRFVVLHTVGSHWHYDSHYPPAFRKWTPLCDSNNPTSCDVAEVVNSYDNALLYTDHFLDQVMRRLDGKKALVMYISDHGEGLGEEGVYSHHFGSKRRVERHVPWVIWASPKFAAEHPERLRALQAHKADALSHDNVFHSILDCAGITSSIVDGSLSVCRTPVAGGRSQAAGVITSAP